MAQGKQNHEFEEETTLVTSGKSDIKSPHMRITQPSQDLNRYIVDNFHLPAAKSQNAPFESIDLTIYRPSAKCVAFSTSEDRLLLWITAFQYRYYELTGNAADYKVIWEEQDSPSSTSKCDKLIIHLVGLTSTGEDQLVALTVFSTTGRIQVQGKKFEEWTKFEFPVLLNIVKSLSDLQPLTSLPRYNDFSLFGSLLHNFFTIFIHFVGDGDIPASNNGENDDNGSATRNRTLTELTEDLEPLTVSPNHLKTIASIRDTLGQLEVDFTHHQIVSSGDLENIKDKIAKQDHLIKVQKQTLDDRYSDLSSQIKSLQEMISQQSKVIRTLQDENQSLHKKTQQITKTNQVLQESENTLKAEINFLKEQVTALWQNTRHTSDEINQPDTTSASSVPSITSEKRPGTPTPSTTETSSPSITPNIPTENRFIPLRDHGESDNTSNS